jgi:ElaB/YqjD/DUF883 family membrane-anchored ribosome-binding protein
MAQTLASQTAFPTSQVMGEQAQEGIERISGTAHEAVDRAATVASSAAGRVGEMGEQLLSAKDEWIDTARDYVREHPAAAIGIAVSVGYLLSRLTAR